MEENNETLPFARNKVSSLIATISIGVITHKAFEHIFLLGVQHKMVHCIFVPFDWLQVIDADSIPLLASQVVAAYNSWAKHRLLIR